MPLFSGPEGNTVPLNIEQFVLSMFTLAILIIAKSTSETQIILQSSFPEGKYLGHAVICLLCIRSILPQGAVKTSSPLLLEVPIILSLTFKIVLQFLFKMLKQKEKRKSLGILLYICMPEDRLIMFIQFLYVSGLGADCNYFNLSKAITCFS